MLIWKLCFLLSNAGFVEDYMDILAAFPLFGTVTFKEKNMEI